MDDARFDITERLLEISLNNGLGVLEAAREVLDTLNGISKSEWTVLLKKEPDNTDSLANFCITSRGEHIFTHKRLDIKTSHAGKVFENPEGRHVVDLSKNPYPEFSMRNSNNIKYCVSIPVYLDGAVTFVLHAAKAGLPYPDADLKFFNYCGKVLECIFRIRNYSIPDAAGADSPFMFLQSKEMKDIYSIVDKVAGVDSPVFIQGESGTGKGIIARLIHQKSARKNKPFIHVNCAAIPENLFESELFGHVAGAFTDAVRDRKGRFELADEGTLFLDELGDMPVFFQTRILRVLASGVVDPVGSQESIFVNVRIIAATNKDVKQLLSSGKLRQDLFYRLNVIPVTIPPLRKHPSDIMDLVNLFIKRYNRLSNKHIKGMRENALSMLMEQELPGNIRELENMIERAVMISDSEYITSDHLFMDNDTLKSDEADDLKTAMKNFKKRFISRKIEENAGNKTRTAKAMGIQRTYLSRLINELDIEV